MPSIDSNSIIFGVAVKLDGPVKDFEFKSQQLPGVAGERVYAMGSRSLSWMVKGRLIAMTGSVLNQTIAAGQAFMDGKLHTFVDGRGKTWRNCQVVDFKPFGQVQRLKYGTAWQFSVLVQCSVKCVLPP